MAGRHVRPDSGGHHENTQHRFRQPLPGNHDRRDFRRAGALGRGVQEGTQELQQNVHLQPDHVHPGLLQKQKSHRMVQRQKNAQEEVSLGVVGASAPLGPIRNPRANVGPMGAGTVDPR